MDSIPNATNILLKPSIISEEEKLFTSLRAKSWDEFHGQYAVKKSLAISIQAAKKRGDAVEHILLYGPPGLGKTTLAHIVGKEMETTVKITSGPTLERSGDLAAILTNLEKGDILFIDEIHRISKVVEETLYSAMEDFALDIMIGKGPGARSVRLDLPQFTIIGATTRVGLLSAPLRDRFGVVNRLQFYEPQDLVTILKQGAAKLHVTVSSESLLELAKRSRGTPRIGLRLLKRVRDVAEIKNESVITPKILEEALQMMNVDPMGLDEHDRHFLLALINKFQGGPVGLDTLAASLSEDIGTLEDMIEPYLLQIGFINRTPRGRMATKLSYAHFGLAIPTK